MQRRGAQRSSGTRNESYSSSSVDANDKKKRRKISSSVFYAVGLFVILVVCLPLVLTPSQKKELSEVEQAIWRQYQQQTTGSQVEQQSISNNKEEEDDDDDDVKEGDNKAVDGEGKSLEEQHDDKEDTSANNADGAPPNAATARMEAQSSRWVDGEKALKKKLMVLYEQQMKGKYLGVPVVTRYLGEDIPAYIGTPDSPMAEDEWKKLVEAKYEEMRLEEEEWRKKMEALIATRERDMGITTA